jgi:hypothetical protein
MRKETVFMNIGHNVHEVEHKEHKENGWCSFVPFVTAGFVNFVATYATQIIISPPNTTSFAPSLKKSPAIAGPL